MQPSRVLAFWPPLGINLLALGVGVWKWRGLDRPLRILAAYLTLSVFTTVGIEILVRAQGPYQVLVHLFAPLELIAFAWMYASWSSQRLGQIFKGAAVAYGASCLVMLPFENLRRFTGPSFHIETLLMLAGTLTFLCHLALKTDRLLSERAGFWVASGALPDMAVSLILYASRDWLVAHAKPWLPWLFLFRALIVTLSYLCFGWAFTYSKDSSEEKRGVLI